jgi:methionine aminopeptidase
LQKHCDCISDVKKTALKRAQKENKVHKLLDKGIYTEEARSLTCLLTKAGCSPEYVGSVIETVCKSAGVEVVGKMSRHTVGRAIIEGGVAAKMQLGYELKKTKGKYILGFKTWVRK